MHSALTSAMFLLILENIYNQGEALKVFSLM